MRGLVIAVMAAMLILALTNAVQAESDGVVQGRILNGTLEEKPVTGIEVNLRAFEDQEPRRSWQQTTGDDGRFRFEGLDKVQHTYELDVDYQDVRYGSDVLAFSPDSDVINLSLSVYEAVADDANLRVERAHLILDMEAATIHIQEVQIFSNDGDTTYVGSVEPQGDRTTLRFPLPNGASNLQMLESPDSFFIIETDDGFAYTMPILPGQEQFAFAYQVEKGSGEYTLMKEVPYPIGALDVLVADVGVSVTAPGMTIQEPRMLQGRSYLHFTAEKLSTDDQVSVHLGNSPVMGETMESAEASSDILVRAVMGLGTLAVLGAIGYPFLGKPS